LILSSPDGVAWTPRTSPVPFANLNSVAFGNGLFVAVGDSGTLLTSSAGVNWISNGPIALNHLRGVAFGNDLFVAVGDAGTIRTSNDAVIWNQGISGTASDLFGVIHGGGRFVSVGSLGVFVTSVNGSSWAPGATGASFDLNGIAHGKGIFVAVGNGGTVFTSSNGTAWTNRTSTSGTTGDLQGVAVGNGPFVTVGNTGTIRTSSDGVTWTQRTSGVGLNLNGIAYGEGTYIAIGASGTILQSDPIIAFNDVPLTHLAFISVDTVAVSGIAAGCVGDTPGTPQNEARFCPDDSITRAQMAVFIETSLGNPPNTCTGGVFTDVNTASVGTAVCGFIEKLFADGITGGCTPTQFCPNAPVTRAQMAAFIEKALNATPAVGCQGTFLDVNTQTIGDTFCSLIEDFATRGITSGCGGGNFCPSLPVTRAQMAVFLVAAPAPLNP
jgi:hypothetical protein